MSKILPSFYTISFPFQTVVIFPRRTALHIAVRDGSVEFVRLLLDNHANVNIGDENDVTPLHTASCLGLMDIARILLQTGRRQHQHCSLTIHNLLSEQWGEISSAANIRILKSWKTSYYSTLKLIKQISWQKIDGVF